MKTHLIRRDGDRGVLPPYGIKVRFAVEDPASGDVRREGASYEGHTAHLRFGPPDGRCETIFVVDSPDPEDQLAFACRTVMWWEPR